MKVFCRTNIDIFKREIWPKEMCCRPIVGDRIQSDNGMFYRVGGVSPDLGFPLNNDKEIIVK